ncbi:MAG: phosphoglycerate mutase, partial [Methanothrix sp.]|nr:phosphoglycerate mutase [Methanothrix sp.]
MKLVVLLGDGMADLPLSSLQGKTPLQKAKKPNMDSLAKRGRSGLARTVPDGFPPGSDVANLSVMGYSPAEYYTGRAPL